MRREFKVNEVKSDMEHIIPFDRFGLNEKTPDEEVSSSCVHSTEVDKPNYSINEKGAEAPSYGSCSPAEDDPSVSQQPYDYTKQLEFHKQEVADAEKRGMPEAQVDYHLGKIAVLEKCPGPPPKFEQHQLDCRPEDCNCGK